MKELLEKIYEVDRNSVIVLLILVVWVGGLLMIPSIDRQRRDKREAREAWDAIKRLLDEN